MTTRAQAAAKRLKKAQADVEKEGEKIAAKVEECLRKLGFKKSYAEAAANEIANDFMDGLESGEHYDLPPWIFDEDEELAELEDEDEEDEDGEEEEEEEGIEEPN